MTTLTSPLMQTAEDIRINGLSFNKVDENGLKWIIEDIDGWWNLPDGSVPTKPMSIYQDGSVYVGGRYLARNIVITGRILPTDTLLGAPFVLEARRALHRSLNTVRSYSVLEVDESDASKRAIVQLVTRPRTTFDKLSNSFKFTIEFRAVDPRKYSLALTTESVDILGQTGGRTYDRSYVWFYSGGGSDGLMHVNNEGSYNTFGTLRLYGPVTGPRIEHLESGHALEFDITLSTENDYLEIDLQTHSVLLNGLANRRNTMIPSSEWFDILPGTNTLRFLGQQIGTPQPYLRAATNLFPNPSAENSAGTVNARQNLARDPLATLTTPPGPGGFYSGRYSSDNTFSSVTGATDGPLPGISTYTRLTMTVAGVGVNGHGFALTGSNTQAGNSGVTTSQDIPASAGLVYTASAYLRASNAGHSGSIAIRFGDATTTWLAAATVSSPVSLPQGGWVRVSVSAAAPVGTTRLAGIATFTDSTGSVIGETLDGTALLVENSTALNPFFAGSFAMPTRYNLLPNPSLETASTGWASGSYGTSGTGTATRLSGDSYVGSYYHRMTWTTASTAGNPYVYCGGGASSFAAVSPGTTYTASIWVRCSESRNIRAVAVRHTSPAPTGWFATAGSLVSVPANTWTRLSVTFTPGAGEAWARVVAEIPNQTMPLGATFDADAAMIELGSVLTEYFDASLTPRNGFAYGWTGTAHAAPSKEIDADFTTLWSGTANASISFMQIPTVNAGTTGSTVATTSTHWVDTRTKSARLIRNTNSSINDNYWSPGGDTGAMRLNMVAGNTYTVAATGRIETPLTGSLHPRSRSIVAFWKTTSGGATYFSQASAPVPNTTNTSQRIQMTFTLPADTVEAFLRFYNGSSTGFESMWWDSLFLVEGEWAEGYFDGNSVGWTWSGTPDLSTSSRPEQLYWPAAHAELDYRSAWLE